MTCSALWQLEEGDHVHCFGRLSFHSYFVTPMLRLWAVTGGATGPLRDSLTNVSAGEWLTWSSGHSMTADGTALKCMSIHILPPRFVPKLFPSF